MPHPSTPSPPPMSTKAVLIAGVLMLLLSSESKSVLEAVSTLTDSARPDIVALQSLEFDVLAMQF